MNKCECGCGRQTSGKLNSNTRNPIKFVAGHHFRNKLHSIEAKEKMRQAQLGKTKSEETKFKMSEQRKGNKFAAGIKHSKERIETRLINIRGVPKSAEHKAKIAEGNRGKTISEETKRKMSEAAKRRWQTA